MVKGQRIQTTIPNKPEFESWKQDVIEGKIFEFEIFQVSMNTPNFRPNNHLYKLLFSDKTSYYTEEAAIPESSFSVLPISDIIGVSDTRTINHLFGKFILNSPFFENLITCCTLIIHKKNSCI